MAHKLTETVEELSEPSSLKGLFHQHRDGYPLPSSTALEEIIQLARAILFPGYFGKSQVNVKTIKYQIGVNVERLQKLLSEQILAGLCFADSDENAEEKPAADSMMQSTVNHWMALRRTQPFHIMPINSPTTE